MALRLLSRRAAQLARPKFSQSVLRSAPAAISHRNFTLTTARPAGIMPETEDPKPAKPEATHNVSEPMPLSDDAYHALADKYLDRVVAVIEEVAEGREDVDVDFSAGVLTIAFPPKGTYVLNKQPPNRQIWLSSPVTGPKRYDWVVAGEDTQSKEGSGVGDWVYMRDGSSLTELLRKELGVSVVGVHD